MAEINYTEAVDIAAPVERVYDYRLDFTNLPDYNPSVSNFRQTAGEGPGVGAEYVFDLEIAPGAPPMESPIKVTTAERPSRIVFDTGPGFMATEDCTFRADGDLTHVEFAYVVRIPGDIDDATRDAIVAQGSGQARTELDHMKKALES